ncbi:MAG: hypothetical protein D6753_17770 [Planctomycetota bacterium]|nr:MAG: hypothetical protein D6753_17770 [Planctomycetota bacterium]
MTCAAGVLLGILFSIEAGTALAADEPRLRLSTFAIEVNPRVGKPLAYDPMIESTGPLSCRGIVLLPTGQQPIVLCAVDWLGVANQSQVRFRQELADAVGTTLQRVVVHALHQHDAPRCDLSAAEVLEEYGLAEQHYDIPYLIESMQRAADAARRSLAEATPIVAVSHGRAKVEKVASNRRMIGPDGKVFTTRYTACRDPKIRALPEGVIDPWLQMVAFHGPDGIRAVMSFYATHPQSYYRTGQANPDFPGMARDARQQATGIFHLHFNGAGGNVGAGKYNDGSHENRQVLADRVARAMEQALADAQTHSEEVQSVEWKTKAVHLPVGEHLVEQELRRILADPAATAIEKLGAAKKLALLKRSPSGVPVDIACLRINNMRILFMPGELFVEYQLAAQAMRPDVPVMMAAYGEYGTGYIGTRVAYPQGGYEVSPRASNVSPEVESVLIPAMRELLGARVANVWASDFTDTIGPLP